MATQDAPSSGVSFETTEEWRLIRSSLDEFIEREVATLSDDLGETWSNPRLRHEADGRLVPEVVEAIEEIRRRSAEAGFYAMNMPEEAGGEGVSNVTWYRAKKHVASHGPGLSRHVLAGPEGPKPLLLQAEGEQVERYLEPTMRAEKSAGFAQTEPAAGSDSPAMATRAERDGDEWVLNGTKQWITNAPYADFLQVFARTTPREEAGRYGGITCFLVEREEYEVGSLNNAVGSVGRQAEVHLDDVRLGDDRVLGTPDEAFYEAMGFLSLGRMELGAEAVGGAEFLLDRATAYARDREAFGRPIGAFQGVSHKLAAGRAKSYAADAAGYRLAWKMDEGREAIEDSSIFKWFATRALWEVADATVQVHGGNGLSEDNPFMDALHHARILRIVEGTDEIQLNTIAKQMGLR
ncbi:acyl-CoA dehydrogenase family protein [Halomarina halobia]|uniref:Acyl-CoA dehydrogenase family protein n=1 Tax=Halomarina halobia TaxID=3033386 RepID=A0ABD6A6Y1_9EURY|nr:acyl-CoA dehydrogenase family protein [Halomarina sp. PSR21]